MARRATAITGQDRPPKRASFASGLHLPGQKVGRLTALCFAGKDGQGHRLVLCLCACGRVPLLRASRLRCRDQRSCGCLHLLDRRDPPPPGIPGCVWIPLGHKRFALLDAADAWLVEGRTWRMDSEGYVSSWNPGTRRHDRLHQILMGEPPAGLLIDHIFGDRLDHRRPHLRFATPRENAVNRKGRPIRYQFRAPARREAA